MNNREWKPMRQGQQNRRGRGRNNNGGGGGGGGGGNNNQHRKGQNPLTRSFESNGPDMKIRGTPAHIAEKYIALARDAHSAGDPVLAENYLQHAEHYNRIILAYREQQMSQGGGDMNVARPRPAQLHEPMDGDDGVDDEGQIDPAEAPQPQIRHVEPAQPQPQRIYDNTQQRFDQPREHREGNRDRDNRDRDHREGRDNRPRFNQDGQPTRRPHRDRFDRGDNRGERGYQGNRFQGDRFGGEGGGERPAFDRPQQDRHQQGERSERPPQDRAPSDRIERAAPDRAPEPRPEPRMAPERAPLSERGPDSPAPEADAAPAPRSEPRRRERFAQSAHEQPEFLRRPVRRPRRETPVDDEAGDAAPGPAPVAVDDTGRE